VSTKPAPRIYTRTGDAGETGLFDGTRVSKADPRVDAYGDVDELASWLGLVRARLTADERAADIVSMLEHIQRDLFAVGALLADPRHRIADRVVKAALGPDDVARLEGWIDMLDAELTPLRKFILAGGTEAGAGLHLARAVCRRAERRIAGLGDHAHPNALTYVNRLSDLIFTLARAVNARAAAPELEW
jgi:cob(I)alamin adenosyltransferase